MSDAEVIKKRQRDSLFPTAGRGAGTAEGAKGRKAKKQGGAASPKVGYRSSASLPGATFDTN